MKAVLVLSILLASCTLPRIHVVEDPLSAAQHNQLGFVYESQGSYELAEKEYDWAARMEKDWPVPLFNLGNVHYRMGDFTRAEKAFRKALRKDPGNPDFMNNLACALLEQGRCDEALEWIERALSIRRDDEYLDTRMKILRRVSQ